MASLIFANKISHKEVIMTLSCDATTTFTINLNAENKTGDSNATTLGLKLPEETVVGAELDVIPFEITTFLEDNSASFSRNSAFFLHLRGDGVLSNAPIIERNSNFSVIITGGGTVQLRIHKLNGYVIDTVLI